MKQLNWYGLYSDSWQGEITPEAFSHPAKYSRALIRKIYQHMLESGWIKPGDKVVDPFGGVALGAYHALQNGLVWCGCELEPKFVKLGNENIDLWNGRYAQHFAKWGTAVLIQGDSRFLAKNIQGYADISLSSPPYANSINANDAANDSSARQERKLANGIPDTAYHRGGPNSTQNRPQIYGFTDGQLGSMKEGDFEAAVSSSPFEASNIRENRSRGSVANKNTQVIGNDNKFDTVQLSDSTYGSTEGQLGTENNTTFWQAARQIVEQTYQILKPGAYTAWVCGDFIRNKQRIYFGRQWMELCAAVGFEPIEWATAWKTEYKGNQLDIFGNDHEKRIDRVSFFRRLANEKNPDNAILNEDVLFMRKPL